MIYISPQQQQLLNEILSDAQKIPNFIDTKSTADVKIWRCIQSVYGSIINLIAPVFLSNYKIELIDFDIQAELSDIVELTDKKKQSIIIVYLNKKINDYAQRAIELELFEAAQNIKSYQTL